MSQQQATKRKADPAGPQNATKRGPGISARMRELQGRAKSLHVSIAKGQARLDELDEEFRALGLETLTARPKSSLNPVAIKEKLRQRKAQLASAGTAPTAAADSQQSGGETQLASAGIASSTTAATQQATVTDSTASTVETAAGNPESMEDVDEDTEMADSGKLVEVNRSYADMLADPSQRSKHVLSGEHEPDWNPGQPYLETPRPGMPNACLLYWLDGMCPTEMEGRSEDECADTHKWNPNILKHHRFKEALQKRVKLPARTLREIDAMGSRAKLRRDAEGQGKSNTLKIGYKTKHSQRQDGNGASILDEMAGGSSSWADAMQREADNKREMDIDDNPR